MYDKDGNETVVNTNPKAHYPNAEYIDESNHNSDIKVDDREIFTYADVRAQIIDNKIKSYMDDNLKSMEAYGDVPNDGKEVYGSDGLRKNVFYWLHGGHYHAITIKQIIQKEKAKEFGPYTAKDVVAAMKYKIENPGTDLEYKPQVEGWEVVEYLKEYYKIKASTRILQVGNDIYIYSGDESVAINLSEFEKVDGKISHKGKLPEVLSDEELEKKLEDSSKEDEENPSDVDKMDRDNYNQGIVVKDNDHKLANENQKEEVSDKNNSEDTKDNFTNEKNPDVNTENSDKISEASKDQAR